MHKSPSPKSSPGRNAKAVTRRKLLQLAAASSTLGPLFTLAAGQPQTSGAVNKFSSPSNLKITDIRACLVAANFDYPIIRIDTNQGVYGLGECFAGSTMGSALVLKAHLIGKDPLKIDQILGNYGRNPGIRGSAGHDFWNTGYGAIDLALHDIAGKVYGVPAWRLLGNKIRDRVLIYVDTPDANDPQTYGRRLAARKEKGFRFFKMDLYTRLVRNRPGAVMPNGAATSKGLEYLCEFLQVARDTIGWDTPLAADHFGRLSAMDALRYAKAFEPYDLAWAEDFLDWRNWHGYKFIHDRSTTKLLTGELAFGLEEAFIPLIDNQAVDYLHPDIIASGGMREIKRIADYAHAKQMPVAIHQPGSPIGQIAAAHVAATLQNFVACETHAVDIPWWDDLVTGPSKPIIQDGHVPVPDAPGLGIELNEQVVKEHLRYPEYFEPSTAFDRWTAGPIVPRGPWPHIKADGTWCNCRDE